VFSFLEGLVGFLNDLYHRRAELTPSHKVHSQPASIVEILKALPRTNCRACGHPTCMAFAAALRAGEAWPKDCPGFAEPLYTNTVYPVLGPDGTLQSTFTLPSGPERLIEAPTAPAPQGPAPCRKRPLEDGTGIPLQLDLTPREIEVLQLVSAGATNPEISATLQISPHTVKSHIIHIFNKLGVNDRTQAAVWAVQNKVL
jgi:DNA-binding CsgD family transcriptional regulator